MPRAVMIINPAVQKRLIRRRRALGLDRQDEVWDGVYMFMPLGNSEQQELITELAGVLKEVLRPTTPARVFAGCNVSDRRAAWKENFRCPDVAIFLPGNPAEDRGTHWYGGPDFAAEIISPYDHAREKFDFYAKVGVRELLLIDRQPWSLELYRRDPAAAWQLVGRSEPTGSAPLPSVVLPVTLRLLPDAPRPAIEVARVTDGATWRI